MQNSANNLTVAEHIHNMIEASPKTQREISEECGFENPNIITMFKTGATKIPLNRVGPLATALNIDPMVFLRMVMCEYMPDTWNAIEGMLQTAALTEAERELVLAYREVASAPNAVKAVFYQQRFIGIVTGSHC